MQCVIDCPGKKMSRIFTPRLNYSTAAIEYSQNLQLYLSVGTEYMTPPLVWGAMVSSTWPWDLHWSHKR